MASFTLNLFIPPSCFTFILSLFPYTCPLVNQNSLFCFSTVDNLSIGREISVLHEYLLHFGFFMTFEREGKKKQTKINTP